MNNTITLKEITVGKVRVDRVKSVNKQTNNKLTQTFIEETKKVNIWLPSNEKEKGKIKRL